MKAVEIIREIMKNKEVKVSQLASRINVSNAALVMRLKQTNVSVDKMNEMLRVMDYKLVAVPSDSRIPAEGFEVE